MSMHFYITDFVLDAFHNAAEAGSKEISVSILENGDVFRVVVADNGPGMNLDVLKKALDPFFSDEKKHNHRKVGLGLPFLKQSVEMCAGKFDIRSVSGEGTTLDFEFNQKHIDCPPVGSIAQLFFLIFTFSSLPIIHISRKSALLDYSYSSTDLLEVLGGFDTVGEKKLLRDFLASQEH